MTGLSIDVVPEGKGLRVTVNGKSICVRTTKMWFDDFVRDYDSAVNLGNGSVEIKGRRYELTAAQLGELRSTYFLDALWSCPQNYTKPIPVEYFQPHRRTILYYTELIGKFYPKQPDVIVAMTAVFLKVPVYQVRDIYENNAAYARL